MPVGGTVSRAGTVGFGSSHKREGGSSGKMCPLRVQRADLTWIYLACVVLSDIFLPALQLLGSCPRKPRFLATLGKSDVASPQGHRQSSGRMQIDAGGCLRRGAWFPLTSFSVNCPAPVNI